MRVYVEGVGLCAPGLHGWADSVSVLNGERDYVLAPIQVPPARLLPANERRRAVQTVRLALAVGAEAFAIAGRDPAETASVFASSGGDGETIHEILTILASSNREVSPTRFHNSVHNAPAGYWGIATNSQAASSSLCCYDDSFAAGLLEAVVQATAEGRPVALIAYDVQYPSPLYEVRAIGSAFATALVLAPEPTSAALAQFDLALVPGSDTDMSVIDSPELETLRRCAPAARSLPLLVALARKAEMSLSLSYLDGMALTVNVRPASGKPAPCGGEPDLEAG
jgi:Beta-ketoacyl synthase, N-terminal domain